MKYFDNYTDVGRYINLPTHARTALQQHFGRHLSSVTLFVAAVTKVKAIEALSAAGFDKVRPVYLRIGAGNDLGAAISSGVLEDGAVYIKHGDQSTDTPLFKVTAQGTYQVGQFIADEFNRPVLQIQPFKAQRVLMVVPAGEAIAPNILGKLADRDYYPATAGDDALVSCIDAYEQDELPFTVLAVTISAPLPSADDVSFYEIPVAAAVGLNNYL